mgnify:FL=1
MKIKVNDTIPEINFFYISESGPKKISSKELFAGKKVILVGVPGAFTPTCSLEHLPGFIEKKKEIYEKGIEKIIFVSKNDPFVMNEWKKSKSENDIIFIGDSMGEFAEKSGLKMDLSVIGLGERLSRFALIIEDNVIKNIFDEEGGGFEKSSANDVLKAL